MPARGFVGITAAVAYAINDFESTYCLYACPEKDRFELIARPQGDPPFVPSCPRSAHVVYRMKTRQFYTAFSPRSTKENAIVHKKVCRDRLLYVRVLCVGWVES